MSLDESSLDVADTAENGIAFGYPGASRGESAFPKLRFVALAENGTHVLFGAELGRYADSETTLPSVALPPAMPVEPSATPPMTRCRHSSRACCA